MLKRKLRSESGATLLMALLFFLLCALGSSVVLAAGSTASGRIAGLEQDQQAFYTVTSAAQVLQEEINEGGAFTATVVTTTDMGTGISSSTLPAYQYSGLSLILEAAADVYGNKTIHTDILTLKQETVPEGTFDFGTVKASFTMDKDYNISIALSLSDANLADKYQCVVTAKGETKVDRIPGTVTDGEGNVIEETVTEITTVRWSNALIKKNVPSEL